MGKPLTPRDYESLADLRRHIRRFLHFSEVAVRGVGLEPHQHQLMLALKALPRGTRPRIGELAERLQIRHHSTVELVNRLATHGYVQRQKGENDRREVLLTLTPKGERVLRELSLHHRAELRKAGPALFGALQRVMSFDQENQWAGRGPARKKWRTGYACRTRTTTNPFPGELAMGSPNS